MGVAIGEMLPLATGVLSSRKTWLQANNSTVMIVLFVVFGVVLVGKGVGGV